MRPLDIAATLKTMVSGMERKQYKSVKRDMESLIQELESYAVWETRRTLSPLSYSESKRLNIVIAKLHSMGFRMRANFSSTSEEIIITDKNRTFVGIPKTMFSLKDKPFARSLLAAYYGEDAPVNVYEALCENL